MFTKCSNCKSEIDPTDDVCKNCNRVQLTVLDGSAVQSMRRTLNPVERLLYESFDEERTAALVSGIGTTLVVVSISYLASAALNGQFSLFGAIGLGAVIGVPVAIFAYRTTRSINELFDLDNIGLVFENIRRRKENRLSLHSATSKFRCAKCGVVVGMNDEKCGGCGIPTGVQITEAS